MNELLDLSDIEAGSIDFHFEKIDVNDLFRNIYNSFKIRIKGDIEYIMDIPPETTYINMDSQRLNQIISNYLSNAIKFTKSGQIILGYRNEENGIYLYVKDTGIGIAKKNHHKVFNRFEKMDTFAQGSGLGLSICMAIEEAANGNTGFTSEENKGSEFWCRLPYENELTIDGVTKPTKILK